MREVLARVALCAFMAEDTALCIEAGEGENGWSVWRFNGGETTASSGYVWYLHPANFRSSSDNPVHKNEVFHLVKLGIQPHILVRLVGVSTY